MESFKSTQQAQSFLSAHDQLNNLFHLRRDHVTAAEHRAARMRAFGAWTEVSGVAAAAAWFIALPPAARANASQPDKLAVPYRKREKDRLGLTRPGGHR